MVTEVAPQLAADGRDGEAQEVGGLGGVVGTDRLDQAERGHLLEVLQREAAAAVATRDLAGDAQVEGDQLVLERPPALGPARLRSPPAARRRPVAVAPALCPAVVASPRPAPPGRSSTQPVPGRPATQAASPSAPQPLDRVSPKGWKPPPSACPGRVGVRPRHGVDARPSTPTADRCDEPGRGRSGGPARPPARGAARADGPAPRSRRRGAGRRLPAAPQAAGGPRAARRAGGARPAWPPLAASPPTAAASSTRSRLRRRSRSTARPSTRPCHGWPRPCTATPTRGTASSPRSRSRRSPTTSRPPSWRPDSSGRARARSISDRATRR